MTQPLLHTRLVPLDPARHGGVQVPAEAGYGFAAETATLPLLREEFPAVARLLPILFTGEALPVALVGTAPGRNLFVEGEDGRWSAELPPPDCLRRYPFALLPTADGTARVLCIDEAALPRMIAGEPLFEAGGRLSPAGERIRDFCLHCEGQSLATEAFGQAVAQAGLLEAWIPPAPVRLASLFALSPVRFAALDGATLAEWRDKGWLALVYAHFFSLANLPALLARHRAQAEDETPMTRGEFLGRD